MYTSGMTTSTKTPTKSPAYENNPFFVAVNGLELLFQKAQAIGIFFAILVGLSAFSSLPSAFMPVDDTPVTQEQVAKEDQAFADGIATIPVETWLLIGAVVVTILLVLIVIGIVISGIADYTAAQLSQGNQVGFSEALRAVFSSFWGYLWLHIVIAVKVFLWSLLFVIPGIIMAIRYSLAGAVYFDKKLKGNAAVKESARLTKGGWLTTFASQSLLNIITFGIIELLLTPGTQAILYRQYREYDAAGLVKPKAHVLSWLTVIIPLLLILTIVLIVATLAATFSNQ